jgi:cytochrome c
MTHRNLSMFWTNAHSGLRAVNRFSYNRGSRSFAIHFDSQGAFMKFVFAVLFALGVLVSGNAAASEKLAQSSGCMTCHAIDRKVIGPGYKEIAAKYRSDKGAEANLVKKVKAGGSGVWGPTPMPPNAHVKEDDIKAIVTWILTLK